MSAHEFPCRIATLQPLGMHRLHLAPTFGFASVAGLLWPYGLDLTREGPHLVDDFPRGRGRIDRLVYSPGDWDVVAERCSPAAGGSRWVSHLPS